MAVAVPLAVALEVILLLMLRAAVVIVIGGLLGVLADHVPVLGGKLARAIATVVGFFTRLIDRALEPSIKLIQNWWHELTDAATDVWNDLAGFVTDIANKTAWLVKTKIPAMIAAALAPVANLVRELAADIATIDDRLNSLGKTLGGIVRAHGEAIYGDIIPALKWLRETALPAVESRLRAAIHKIEVAVMDDVLPRLGRIEVELPDIRGALKDLRGLMDEVRGYVGPLAAAFGVTAVIELLRHVRRCQPKTERLCRLDVDELEDLLGIAVSAVALSTIIAAVRSSARASSEAIELIRPSLRD